MDDVQRVIGQNVRRLIGERNLLYADVVREMRRYGFPAWTRNRLTQLATGRQPLTWPETVVLCGAVFRVPLTELLKGSGSITLPSGGGMPLSEVRSALANGEAKRCHDAMPSVPTEDEERARAKLGLSSAEFRRTCEHLFGTPDVTEARDRLIGDTSGLSKRSLQSRRGHAMREVIKRLAAHASPICSL